MPEAGSDSRSVGEAEVSMPGKRPSEVVAGEAVVVAAQSQAVVVVAWVVVVVVVVPLPEAVAVVHFEAESRQFRLPKEPFFQFLLLNKHTALIKWRPE